MQNLFDSPLLYGLIPMVGYGINNLLLTRVSRKTGAFKTAFLIQTLAFISTLILFPFFRETGNLNLNFFPISFMGLIGALSYLAVSKAFQVGAVSVISPISSSWVIVAAFLSFLFLKEKVIATKIIGILTVVGGVILVSTDFRKIILERKVRLLAGVKLAGLTALFWGTNVFLLALFSQKMGWYFTNLSLRFWVAATYLGIAVWQRRRLFLLIGKIPKLIFPLVLIDVVAYLSLNLGVSREEPAVVATIAGASPLVSVILATVFFKEKTRLWQIAGIFLCLAGIANLSFT